MANMKVYILVAVLVIAGAVGGFFVLGGDDSDDSSANQGAQTSELSELPVNSNASQDELNTIAKLYASGQALECDYDYTDDSGNRSFGTGYFANQRMSGQFTSVTATDQMTTVSNVVRDDMFQYVWQEGTNEGFKTSIETIVSTETDSTSTNEQFDDNQEFDFDCQSWDVDESLFTPPSDVTFTDFSQQLDELSDTLDQVQDLQATSCSAIENSDARAACEQALAQ